MNKLATSALALSVAIGLAACGGSNNKNNATPVTPAAKQSLTFEGSTISGANYVSGARPNGGVTGVDCIDKKPGCFDVLSNGDKVTFRLGSIELPELTTNSGSQKLTTLDVARAIDPMATINSPAYRAIYAVATALDPSRDPNSNVIGDLNLRPAIANAPTQSLKTIVENAGGNPTALIEGLAAAVAASTGEPVDTGKIDLTAADNSDLSKTVVAGFEGGIMPMRVANFGEKVALPFFTTDLLGLWTASNEDGVQGLSYSDDGLVSFAGLATTTSSSVSFIGQDIPWNIIENRFVSQSVTGERQCIVTERTSAVAFTISCIDFDTDGTKLDEFDANYTMLDLKTLLTADNGLWNLATEKRIGDSGTIMFRDDNSFTDNLVFMENDETVTDSANGTYAISGLTFSLASGDERGICMFAGTKINESGSSEAVYLRCSTNEFGEEDVIYSKDPEVAQLEDTSRFTFFIEAVATDMGFEKGIKPMNTANFGNTPKLRFTTDDLLGLWSANISDVGANGLFYKNNGKLSFANTSAASPGTFSFIVNDVSWNIIDNIFVSQSDLGERQCIVSSRTFTSNFTFTCIDFDTNGSAGNPFNSFYTKIDLAALLSNDNGQWNIAFESRFNEEGSIEFDKAGGYTQTNINSNGTNTASGQYNVNELTLTRTINDSSSDEISETCAFAGIKRNTDSDIEDVYLRCGEPNAREDVLLTKRVDVKSLGNTRAPAP